MIEADHRAHGGIGVEAADIVRLDRLGRRDLGGLQGRGDLLFDDGHRGR